MKNLITALSITLSITAFSQSTWTEINMPTTKHLNAIDFPNQNVGYIGGEDSLLLKTTDGGLTWEEVEYTGITFFNGGEDFLELQFLTSDIGFATVGPYSGAYKTSDGGLTWTQLDTDGSLCYNQGLYFIGPEEGFVGGAGCFEGEKIEKFSIGSSSLSTINSPSWANDIVVDMDFDPTQFNSYGLAASSGGRILRTTDFGDTWDTIPTGLGNDVPLTSITIVNDTLAYAGYDNGGSLNGLLYSTDAGLTWDLDNTSGTFHYPIFNDVYSTPSQVVYSGVTATSPNEGAIYESNDNGWYYHTVDEFIRNITSYNDSIVFAVGENGYVVTNADVGQLATETFEVNESIELYPNPTSDVFNIELPSQIEKENFNVDILNFEGKLIRSLDGQAESISIDDLSSGKYIIKLTSGTTVWTTTLLKR